MSDIKNFENRKLASRPSFQFQNDNQFQMAFERYYNDNFNLRSRIVKIFNWLNLFVFYKSPCPNFVTIGHNGWLFLSGEEMDTHIGKYNFNLSELIKIKNELEYRQQYLQKKNCQFYLMLVPSKACIYPEKLPFQYHRITEKSKGEALLDFLKKNSKLKIVDLFQTFKESKKNGQLYYAIDNHWTRMGALYAAKQFLNQAKNEFPEIEEININDFTFEITDTSKGNTADIIAIPDFFHDVNYNIKGRKPIQSFEADKANYKPNKKFPYPWLFEEVNEIKDTNKPRILIISDSFGAYLFPLLSENFSKTVKIWDNWEYKLNEEIVENEKPQIELLVIHEKNLAALLKYNSH